MGNLLLAEMERTVMCQVLIVAAILPLGLTHMSMVVPIPRNAVDRSLAPWRAGKFFPFSPDCTNCTTKLCVTDPLAPGWNPQIPSGCVPPGTDGWGCNCANGTSECAVAQSCLWFPNGCTIGCKTCTGIPANPNTKDLCNSGEPAKICDPRLRTFN